MAAFLTMGRSNGAVTCHNATQPPDLGTYRA